MKANVQYNDLKGTTAADIADNHDLSDFIERKGFDKNRYRPVGARFFSHYSDLISVNVICIDSEQSTNDEPYIVELTVSDGVSYEEYFGLFKRYEAIVVEEYYQQCDIKGTVRVDHLNED